MKEIQVLPGCNVEEALDYLVTNQGYLLHGSRINIQDSALKANDSEIYATNLASIAILKAIFSNRELIPPGLQYPNFINEANPLELWIHGLHEDTIGEQGFVYLIEDVNQFKFNPDTSHEYITTSKEIPIMAKIDVKRADFNYHVYDALKNIRIQ